MSETIKLSSLERHFQRGETAVQALRGIDLTITPGEFVALVGPSGSGKSTLLNLLGGLDRPSSGELWLNGTPLHEVDDVTLTRHRKEQIGFIFQSFNLLPRLTAVENVAVPLMLAGVPKEERQARARALLERVGLGHRLDHYPAELSGGEQQRTAVARALIHNPGLILADEPTGNLDSATGNDIMSLLQSLNREQGITLVVVTHDPDVAAYADRIVRLHDGQIAEIEERGLNSSSSPSPRTSASPRNSASKLTAKDIIQTALRNLGRRPVRNVLTAGGVLIGIVTLVAMVSFGVGVQREVQRNFETIGLENLFVSPRYAESDGFDPFADPQIENPLTPQAVANIAALPNVVSVTPILGLPSGMDITLTRGDVTLPVYISGGEGMPFRFGPPGRSDMVAGTDLTENRAGAILPVGLADKLLAEGESYDDLVGDSLTLTLTLPRGETADFSTTAVGIQDGFSTRSLDVGVAEREAMIAWWYDDPDFLARQGYDQLVVRTTDLGVVTAVSATLKDIGYNVQSLDAILDVANQVLSLMQALLGSVGGLALLVAALGVANTMMMAIYERTREIGVLKALGASAREIRRLFTVEAGMIGLIGGFFGLIFGTLLGRLVDWIGHRYLINEGVTGVGQLSVVPLWLALGAMAFATFIGVIAGLYPAARAAKLDPVMALRHE
ncbi:MAG: ATP-binding cassette domain-containing protein [Ardenticatenaceae bacterium]|nr:ATP-binding cassette domain-containing protein [Ardenticatenaceae bacterium]MCB8989474.1 ATP-binding cassette domain-containing protein [Ardenticatenaceae bacterium]